MVFAAPKGCVKVNLDGAFDCVSDKGGVGVIFRGDNGTILDGIDFPCKASFAFMVEALVLREAINMAVCMGLSDLLLSLNAWSWLVL